MAKTVNYATLKLGTYNKTGDIVKCPACGRKAYYTYNNRFIHSANVGKGYMQEIDSCVMQPVIAGDAHADYYK